MSFPSLPSHPNHPQRLSRFIEGEPLTHIPSSTINPLFFTILSEQDLHESRRRSQSQSRSRSGSRSRSRSRHGSNSSASSSNSMYTGLSSLLPHSHSAYMPHDPPSLLPPQASLQRLSPAVSPDPVVAAKGFWSRSRSRDGEMDVGRRSLEEGTQVRKEKATEKIAGRLRALTAGNGGATGVERKVLAEKARPYVEAWYAV